MATTTYYLSAISLVLQYFQNMGLMNAGGTVYTYVGGSVGTLVTTYTDSTGLVANPNPMTLNSAGRPASASGAPVAFWVPGGTVVQLQVFDALGNRLVFLDNIPSLNDLTNSTASLQALLASPASSNPAVFGPVAGVDLVANAVKSYDVLSNLRAANVPTLATGQTLNVDLQGALSVNDGLGGFFYWSATATGGDDGYLVIKPANLANASPGRYLRYTPMAVPTRSVLAANVSVASSTTPAPTGLALPLLAGGTYLISVRALLLGSAGTAQGYQLEVTYSGSFADEYVGGGVNSANGTAAAAIVQVGVPLTAATISDTNGDICNLDFVFKVGTQGNVSVLFAQNSSSANPSAILAGSVLTATRLV